MGNQIKTNLVSLASDRGDWPDAYNGAQAALAAILGVSPDVDLPNGAVPVFHGVKLVADVGQTIASDPDVATAISFQATPEFDSDSYFSGTHPKQVTIPAGKGGRYHLLCGIILSRSGAQRSDDWAALIVKKNGSQMGIARSLWPGEYPVTVYWSGIADLAAGAVVELYGEQVSWASGAAGVVDVSSFLCLRRLAVV